MTMQWVTQREVGPSRRAVNRPDQLPTWRTDFLAPPAGTRLPQAFLIEYAPRRMLETHFHDSDEFQIIVGGSGLLGRRPIAPVAVHFARAYTAYGPIVAGDNGLAFLTVRAQRDSMGPQRLAQFRHVLDGIADREPWQASEQATFASTADGVSALASLSNAQGLAAYTVNLPPDGHMMLDGATGDGRFIIVLEGTVRDRDTLVPQIGIGYAAGAAVSEDLRAGPDGVRALVLDFPVARSVTQKAEVSAAVTWHCEQCGFVYDEALGLADDAIAPGTRWSDVPDDWVCPDCLAPKPAFRPRAAS